MKPGRSHRRCFSGDLKGTVLKVLGVLGEEALQVRGRRKPTGTLSHTSGVLRPQPKAAAESGSDWWVRMEQVEDPLDSCCSWEEGARPQGRRKPQGLPVDRSTQGWVTGPQLQDVWRQDSEETQGVLER